MSLSMAKENYQKQDNVNDKNQEYSHLLQNPLNAIPTNDSKKSNKISQDNNSWLYYSFESMVFASIGQIFTSFASTGYASRFTLSLGELVFIILYISIMQINFKIKNKRWIQFTDSPFCDQSNKGFRKDIVVPFIFCIIFRILFTFSIVMSLSLANQKKINSGIIYAIRSCESVLVAIFCYLILKETLSKIQIIGLSYCLLGLIGLQLYSKNTQKETTFLESYMPILLGVLAAIFSGLRIFFVKYLGIKNIDGNTLSYWSMGISNIIVCMLGLILCQWNYGFNKIEYNGIKQQSEPAFTMEKFIYAIIVGFAMYFNTALQSIASQIGYAGPATAIRNSSIIITTLISKFYVNQNISFIDSVFILIIILGLIITSLEKWIKQIFSSKDQQKDH